MDNLFKTTDGFDTTLKLIEAINRSTDDYLFVWDIKSDSRWFFGDIDKYYDIRKDGSSTNTTPEMLKIIHPADSAEVLKSLEQIANGEKDTHNMNYRWINRAGEKVWINCHGTLIRDNDKNPHIMLGRVSEENLRHLYNPLTSLWNKNKLRDDLKSFLKQGKGYLMFLDIDNLATINLTHGRNYGDALLKDIAELCENIDLVEMAYHIDHNYFALVVNASSDDETKSVYEYIKASLRGKCTFTASVVPIDNSLFFDETQLIDSVNMTLKKAKDISNDRIEFFSADDLSQRISSLELLEELKHSVNNNFTGFTIYYQPQISAGRYEIYGVEALLRYNSPTRGVVYPNEFIPILEQSRLIKDVGLWVLEQALAQCKKWRHSLPNLRVSVNFSALQFEDLDLGIKIIEKLEAVNLPGESLTVEITESIGMHNKPQIINIIRDLKSFNISVAIDDFGTGYSNLGYLKQLNIDEIKIDRIFVNGIEEETYNHRLVGNLIEFAKGNNIRTCCEGVESAKELVTLELMLPDLIQGYLFDKPNTADYIEKTYIDSSAKEYRTRIEFINKIYELKEKMGIVHFDPKDILRENEIGLWMMRINADQDHYELHTDEIMEKVFSFDEGYTPKECFEYWKSNIRSDYIDIVMSRLKEMISSDNAVQVEFVWHHQLLGDMNVRLSGKSVNNADGMIVLKGYCRQIDAILNA